MNEHNILGTILAGGKSKRMGKDKLFLKLNDKTLIEHTIEKVKKHFKKIIVITNQDNEFFSKNNLTTVKDCIEGQLGPLAGILTAMKWAKENFNECSWIASFPCDTPFFPEILIQRFIFLSKNKDAKLYFASSKGQRHNIFGLWSVKLYEKLNEDIRKKKARKVEDWAIKNGVEKIEFTFKDYDPFFNINTKEDLKLAQDLYEKLMHD